MREYMAKRRQLKRSECNEDNTMNQSCKVSEHNIETERVQKRKKYMREYMAKRRQLKRSECNEEPPATKVSIHYKEQDANNITIQRKLNKKIYIQRRHSNPEYKDLEKKAMKLKCSDPAYKLHESDTKKAKQLDPVYKQHEVDVKKVKHSYTAYKQHEADAMKAK